MSRSVPTASINNDSTSQPDAESNADAMFTTVYTFVIYDHDKGTTATYPRMATRQTIANMRGKVNEDTAWVVGLEDVDTMGFYVGGNTAHKL